MASGRPSIWQNLLGRRDLTKEASLSLLNPIAQNDNSNLRIPNVYFDYIKWETSEIFKNGFHQSIQGYDGSQTWQLLSYSVDTMGLATYWRLILYIAFSNNKDSDTLVFRPHKTISAIRSISHNCHIFRNCHILCYSLQIINLPAASSSGADCTIEISNRLTYSGIRKEAAPYVYSATDKSKVAIKT